MSYHNEEQINQKKEAVEIAALAFFVNYAEGLYEDNPELLYNAIENLYSLVVEYKRG